LLRPEPPHMAEVGSKHREALQRDAMQRAGRGIPSAVAPARSRGMPEDPTPLGIPKRVSDVWRLADRIAHGGLSPEDWSRLLGQIGGGLDSQELESLLCPGPGLRLLAWKDAFGARAAIEHVFELVLPAAITEAYAEQVVDHFVNGDLLLPWELTSWWQCKHEILPSPSADPTTPEPPPLPWTEDDKAKLNLIALGLYLFDAELYSTYGHYFHTDLTSYDAKPAILLGVIRAADIDEAWSTIVDQLIQALTHLNAMPPVPSDDSIPMATSLFFAEFDEPPMNPDGKTVSQETMRKIWARRLAVALWADVNAHWPWALDELPIDLRNALLGWNPQPRGTGFPGDVQTAADFQANPGPYLAGLNGNNGQWFFEDGTGFNMESVWSGDPFFEWQIAFFGVKPLMTNNSMPSHRDAIYATNVWLLDRAYVHDNGNIGGIVPPKFPGNTSLKGLLERNYGGCWYTGPLLAAISRTLGIPCLFTMTPIIGRNVQSTSPNYATIRRSDAIGHSSVVCRSVDGAFSLFHADFACAFKGQRYGEPSLMWVPFAEWLMVHLIFHGNPIGSINDLDILNMLSAHWYNIGRLQVCGMAASAELFYQADEQMDRTFWIRRLLLAVNNDAQCPGEGSWLDQVRGGASPSTLAAGFLALGDNQEKADLKKHAAQVLPGGQTTMSMEGITYNLLPLEWKYNEVVNGNVISHLLSQDPDVIMCVGSLDMAGSIAAWIDEKDSELGGP